MNVPADLKYTDHDEWIRVEGDVVTIGITEFAQNELGEIVHFEPPEEGESFDAGDAVTEVESVKAVAEVFTPVAGTVASANEALEDEPEKINEDPYGEGWLVKLTVTDLSGLDGLMDAAAYAEKRGD